MGFVLADAAENSGTSAVSGITGSDCVGLVLCQNAATVTWNGTGMTLVDTYTDIDFPGETARLFRIDNPTNGDIVLGGSGTRLTAWAVYDDSVFAGSNGERYDGAGPATRTLTTESGDTVVQMFYGSWSSGNADADTGSTMRHNGPFSDFGGIIVDRVATGTSTTTGITGGGFLAGWHVGIRLEPAASNDTFTIASQPTTGTTGDPLGTFTVESSDATSTATVTATKASGPGNLSGTTSVAMVSGVASFTTLEFDAAGTYTLQFAATGHDSITSASITVSDPPSGTVFRSYYDNL